MTNGVAVWKPYLKQRYGSGGKPTADPNSKRRRRVAKQAEKCHGGGKMEMGNGAEWSNNNVQHAAPKSEPAKSNETADGS